MRLQHHNRQWLLCLSFANRRSKQALVVVEVDPLRVYFHESTLRLLYLFSKHSNYSSLAHNFAHIFGAICKHAMSQSFTLCLISIIVLWLGGVVYFVVVRGDHMTTTRFNDITTSKLTIDDDDDTDDASSKSDMISKQLDHYESVLKALQLREEEFAAQLDAQVSFVFTVIAAL
jgi:hypothetical protein